MNFKKLLLCMSVAGMVASCTSDIDLCDVGAANEQEKSEITINVAPFVCDNDAETRAYLNGGIDNNGVFSPVFELGEEFGICTEDGIRDCFVKSTAVTSNGVTGSVINNTLKKGDEFRIFYPRSGASCVDGCLYMDFDQQKLNLSEVDSKGTTISSRYNYFVSGSITYKKKNLGTVFMNPLNAVIKINVKLPKGDYSKIELVNVDGKTPFYTKAYVNLFSSDEIEDDEDVEEEEEEEEEEDEYNAIGLNGQSSLSLQLVDFSVDEEAEYSFYFAVCPSEIGKIEVKVTDGNGNSHVSKKQYDLGDVKRGYGYVLDCTLPDMVNGHEYVNLGLPSGTMWAKTNVGTENITEGGNFYTWSEGVAVAESYGEGWHLPSYDEMLELIRNCYMEKCVDYNGTGIKGDIFYKPIKPADRGATSFPGSSFKKRDGYTLDQPHIFFPYAGMYDEDGDFLGRTCFAVWTSDKSGKIASIFGGMYNSGNVGQSRDIPVNFRVQVRPVYSK